MVIATAKHKQQIYNDLIAYRDDPIGCFVNMLDVKPNHIWSKMVDICESVRDNQFTAVPAGHDVSKTYTAGRVAVWFKTCFQPSTVITTAPSDNQVRNQLWREIHTAHAGAKVNLGGKISSLMWDVKPQPDVLKRLTPADRALWEKNFAIGFSTSPDTVTEHATKMQGWHNQWLLVILDEACGIMPQIWRTVMESLIVNERCKVLAIGNLTDPLSPFAKACEPDSGWNTIRISVKDTPNYIERREIIPNVTGRAYEESIRTKYGIHSNTYKIRVLGEAPEYREGTFYGKELAEALHGGRVGEYPHDPTAKVFHFWDLGDIYSAGIFAQVLRGRIRIIDCYWDNQGLGIPTIANVMHAKRYIYADGFAGPDLDGSNRKSAQTGMATRDVAAQLGIGLRSVIRHSFEDGIEATRGIWPLLEINQPLCKTFIDAAKGYRKRKNEALSTEDQPVYYQEVLKTWERHMMDALRHLAIAYRYMDMEGQLLGISALMPEMSHVSDMRSWDYDPLGRK